MHNGLNVVVEMCWSMRRS